MDEQILPDCPAARLLEMLERLPLMNGALTARATAESQQGQGSVSGVTVGAASSTGFSKTGSPRGPASNGVEQVDSSGAMLTGHPALAGLVEYVKV